MSLPILNFSKLVADEPKKYVFVPGIGTKIGNEARLVSLLNDKRIIAYKFLEDVKEFFDYDYVFENKKKFSETYNLLSDELSKKTLLAYLKTRVTENPNDILDFVCNDEYFNDMTARKSWGKWGYIDCGAYNGDTVEQFIKFAKNNYGKIFAIEADSQNASQIKNLIKEKNYKNVEIFNCGVWNKKDTLRFISYGNSRSYVSEKGTIEIPMDTIDNLVGNFPIKLIKMDIEGAELNALKGAVKTLERCRPVLAISVYHRSADLITIPQFIKNIYGDCKFYIRKYDKIHPLWELDLYAVPD